MIVLDGYSWGNCMYQFVCSGLVGYEIFNFFGMYFLCIFLIVMNVFGEWFFVFISKIL